MAKIAKGAIEKAIKAGMKSVGYSGKSITTGAQRALREAKLGGILHKGSVTPREAIKALKALKEKGFVSELRKEKSLLRKGVAEFKTEQKKLEVVEEKKPAQAEERAEARVEEAKERLHERTAKSYIKERREEGSEEEQREQRVAERMERATKTKEEKGSYTASKPVRASIAEISKEPKEEPEEELPPVSAAKDLPI